MSKVRLSVIAAVSDNNVIGRDGKLPWYLPDDLKHFHDITVGHAVIMGHKTYESIPKKHRPLPDRTNIIVTRQDMGMPGCIVVHSFEEAIEQARYQSLKSKVSNPEVFVIGGAEIYRQALPLVQRIYLTRVHTQVDGDAFFPDVAWGEWLEISREEHPADTRHAYAFTFAMYKRRTVGRRGERENISYVPGKPMSVRNSCLVRGSSLKAPLR